MDREQKLSGAARPTSLALALSRLDRLSTPWPWGFNVLGVSLLFQAVNFGIAISSFTFFAERWMVEFGVARSEIMLAATFGAIGPALLGPVAGRAMDTLPARRVIAGGLVALVLGLFLLSQVTAVWQIVLIYALVLPISGSFAGAIPAQVLAARWFAKRRGFALGLVSAGISLGGVVFVPLIVWLITGTGWRTTYGLFALGTGAVLLPLVVLLVRSSPEGEHPRRLPEAGEKSAPGTSHTVRTILMERNFWVLFVFLFPMGIALSVIQFNLAGFSAERGLSIAQAGALISILSLMLLLAKFGWGYLADRVEHRLLFFAAALANLTGCFVLSAAEGFGAVCGALIIIGLAIGGILPLTGAVLAEQFGPAFGRAFGLVTMSLPLTLVGPPLAARLQEGLGSYAPVLAAVAGFVSVSALSALFLRKSPQPLGAGATASMSSKPKPAR